MKKELKNIADHLDRDIITEQEARTLLLGLLGVKQQSELLKEIFELTDGAWDDPVISEDLYNRMEAAISFNCG